MTKGFKSKLFECKCSSLQHIFRVTLDEATADVFIEMTLNTWLPFRKRVALALNYVFRPGKSLYGCYDEVILDRDAFKAITEMFEESKRIAESRGWVP